MSAAATRGLEPQLTPAEAVHLLWEELACAIAASQAALFHGELHELESAIGVQQEICLRIQSVIQTVPSVNRDQILERAGQAQRQNLVFAATVRRMQRHLDSLRSVLDGPSPSYGADQRRRAI